MIFSIAVPVLGQAEFLATALTSVASQCEPYALAVLDATPDDSAQRVLSAYQSFVSFSRYGPDEGQAAAIQEGWNQVKGEILHWLNADDYLMPGTLTAVASVFTEHPSVDVVYGDALFVDRAGTFMSYFPAISDNARSLLVTCSIAQPACFVRRSAVERIGGLNTRLHYTMDWNLWTRLYVSGAKFFYLRRPLAAIRMYPETKTGSGSPARLQEIRDHLRQYAGWTAALRATARFIADVDEQDVPAARRLLAYMVRGYRKCKIAMARVRMCAAPGELYGLEVHTNRVRKCLELWLPWYNEQPPRQLVVSTDRGRQIDAYIDRARIVANAVDLNESGQTFVFSLPKTIPQHLRRIYLCDRGSKPWRLTSAQIR